MRDPYCPEWRAPGRHPWDHEPHCSEGRVQRRSWYFTAGVLLLLLLLAALSALLTRS